MEEKGLNKSDIKSLPRPQATPRPLKWKVYIFLKTEGEQFTDYIEGWIHLPYPLSRFVNVLVKI